MVVEADMRTIRRFTGAGLVLCVLLFGASARTEVTATSELVRRRQPLPSHAPLVSLSASDLCVTSGKIESAAALFLKVTVPGMRLVAARRSSRAELMFDYRGPSVKAEPLGNGEVRRQIGLKLRARDTCNVVYVMWHVEPSPGIFVSVKSNPGESTHAQCADRGYVNLPPAKPAPTVAPGTRHALAATIDLRVLRVTADGVLVWEGALPDAAFAFDGPAGVRADNGEFEFQLRVPSDARDKLACPRPD